jgi:hypothetical protein
VAKPKYFEEHVRIVQTAIHFAFGVSWRGTISELSCFCSEFWTFMLNSNLVKPLWCTANTRSLCRCWWIRTHIYTAQAQETRWWKFGQIPLKLNQREFCFEESSHTFICYIYKRRLKSPLIAYFLWRNDAFIFNVVVCMYLIVLLIQRYIMWHRKQFQA